MVEPDHVEVPRFHFPSRSLAILSLSPLEFDAAYGAASAHTLRAMSTPKIGEEGRKEGLNFLELDFDFYVGDFLLHAER